MQEFGLVLLHETEKIAEYVDRQNDLADRVRVAIVTHDPMRLPDMFPAFAPPAEADNKEADKALEANAPVEIRTTATSEEAQDFLAMLSGRGELGIDDLGSDWDM